MRLGWCFTQAGLDPLGAFARFPGSQLRFGFGDEGFGFGKTFRASFGLEFFFLSALSPEPA